MRKIMAYTYLDLVEEVLKESKKPMTIREILDYAEKNDFMTKMKSVGKTPEKTINANIHKNIARGESARFKQISKKPALFDLK